MSLFELHRYAGYDEVEITYRGKKAWSNSVPLVDLNELIDVLTAYRGKEKGTIVALQKASLQGKKEDLKTQLCRLKKEIDDVEIAYEKLL